MRGVDLFKAIVLYVAFAAGAAASAFAAAEDAIGTWLDTDTGGVLAVYSCTGGICVKVVTPSKGREIDSNNPDPALKGRSMAGVDLMTGASKDGADTWKGQLYNSEDGKTYTGYVVVKSRDEAKLEGCITSFLCKTHTLKRQQ
jgi:uncharacterized protein (DUF2147 family)